ncbi:MAG: UvrD-helicase domain-containing protein [Lachnospiraceae bacterium]|nr:UvrD-helicase domain-containing protein [Lachnospiraceae bacterium]
MDLHGLNDKQQEVVRTTEGPVLVLAGAGSGKTRALTHRIAYLIEEKGVRPWNILAITFTNKAAGEMRERVIDLLPSGGDQVWVATFHATCVRILRRYGELLGYERSFSIYDTDDQKTLMRQVMKTLELDPKMYKERSLLAAVSDAKNRMVSPEQMAIDASGDYRRMRYAEAYAEYQVQLKKNNAMDFDDLLVKTVELFQNCPEVLAEYQEKFRYILVDEYQDTNGVQFRLVKLLSEKYRNVCVVGDDDQSIYKFRGADIRNILDFEDAFPGATVIRLEQNYRSTGSILDAANHVIANNEDRKAKRLWTENETGAKVRMVSYDTAQEEAEGIVRMMENAVSRGIPLRECAVLYRTNAQSRALEERCVTRSLPYRLVGGVNFYQRKEIKDILAYLRTVANGLDDISVLRILNVPKRGIGQTTQAKVAEFAQQEELSFYDALCEAEAIPGLGKAAAKLDAFVSLIERFRVEAEEIPIADVIDMVLEESGYQKELEETEDDTTVQSRLENIEELKSKAEEYESEAGDDADLAGFLEDIALVADVDRMDDSEERLTLMTLHSAKGLEFTKVVISGMEDGLFPSFQSINDVEHPEQLEEERRLAYVGITRAKKELTLTMARTRMVNGETRYGAESRFVAEIPENLLEREDKSTLYRPQRERRDLYQTPPRRASKWDAYADYGKGSLPYQGGGSPFGKDVSQLFELGRSAKKAAPAPAVIDYHAGDRVRHTKFGDGTVLSMEDGPHDTEVTVEFDRVGIKKMMAGFAKLRKIED